MAVTDFFQDVAGLFGAFLVLVLVALASKGITRTKGREIKYHLIYAVFPLLSFFLMPLQIKEFCFTPLSVVATGTVYPIYESIRAVCTIGASDDTVSVGDWLW